MADTRICPECQKTFKKDDPKAIWYGDKMFCCFRCRQDYIDFVTHTFHPLHHERGTTGGNYDEGS